MGFLTFNNITSTGNLLDLIGNRQKVLGKNLANADTPGYTRHDINFADNLSMATTGESSLQQKMSQKFGMSSSPSEDTGEQVNMANELMEIQKNSLVYTMATRQMSSIITQMKTVVNVGK